MKRWSFAILVVLLLIPLRVTVLAERTPIDFKSWQLDDTTFQTRFGGPLMNYKDTDSSWAAITNDWVVTDDSISCITDVLKTVVTLKGITTMRANWAGDSIRVQQAPSKLVWLNTSDWSRSDITSVATWGTPIVDGNTITWANVWPGVDYRITKDNGQIAHGVLFKPTFLDTAETLFDIIADPPDTSITIDTSITNADIALGGGRAVSTGNLDTLITHDTTINYDPTVTLGILSGLTLVNVDNNELAAGTVNSRRLKTLGRLKVDLLAQGLHFPGEDTLASVPVRQRWTKKGATDICVEFVEMGQIKRLSKLYPDSTIWHNTVTEFGYSNLRDAYMDDGAGANNNLGISAQVYVRGPTAFMGWQGIDNVADVIGPNATITAAADSMFCYTSYVTGTVYAYRCLKGPIVEGDENGVNNDDGDITYNDWASDANEWSMSGARYAADSGDQWHGCPDQPSTQGSSALTAYTFLYPPMGFPVSGFIDTIECYVNVEGTFTFAVFSQDGSSFTDEEYTMDTNLTVGLHTLIAGTHFTAMPMNAGDFLGFHGASPAQLARDYEDGVGYGYWSDAGDQIGDDGASSFGRASASGNPYHLQIRCFIIGGGDISDNSGDGVGPDRKKTAEDSQYILLTDDNVRFGWDLSTDLVQGWYDGTIEEYGLIFAAYDNTAYAMFRAHDYSTTSQRSFVTITYTGGWYGLDSWVGWDDLPADENSATVTGNTVIYDEPCLWDGKVAGVEWYTATSTDARIVFAVFSKSGVTFTCVANTDTLVVEDDEVFHSCWDNCLGETLMVIDSGEYLGFYYGASDAVELNTTVSVDDYYTRSGDYTDIDDAANFLTHPSGDVQIRWLIDTTTDAPSSSPQVIMIY